MKRGVLCVALLLAASLVAVHGTEKMKITILASLLPPERGRAHGHDGLLFWGPRGSRLLLSSLRPHVAMLVVQGGRLGWRWW